jgi:hypothetical protein
MNRSTEKINAGHYLVKTAECGQFSVSKHEGAWVLRNEGHMIDCLPTKKEAMRQISESQRIVRHNNAQDDRKTAATNTTNTTGDDAE